MLDRMVAGVLIAVLACPSWGSPLQAAPAAPAPPPPDASTATSRQRNPCTPNVTAQEPKGILVETPKIYDDAVMQQQLEANFARLSALSGFDQGSLTSHLGNVSGVNQSYASGSLNLQGAPTNQQTTTAGAANVQTILTNTSSTGSTASNAAPVPVSNSQTNAQTTSNPATTQTVTLQPSVTVPASVPQPVAPAVTTGLSVQSSAILSEQLQLASRLSTELLEDEGALSDRIERIDNGRDSEMRARATVGFDVTVAPTGDEKDAAAVVEVIVSNCAEEEDVPPAVTALMPSEATFNIAAVRNTSVNLGAGLATAFLGASGGLLAGHNQYFLVQDQDTVAQVFQPSAADASAYCGGHRCLGIRWIFRPVLGKRFVGPGRRKIVAQLAFPTAKSADQYGSLIVRTTWRSFDRKTGLVGDELDDRKTVLYASPVLAYRLNAIKPRLDAQSVEDLGNGQVLVHLQGAHLAGTYVRIGNTALVDPPSGLIREPDSIRFLASAADLMTKHAFLVSRSGEEAEIFIDRNRKISVPNAVPAYTPVVTTLDATLSHLSVTYCEEPDPIDNSRQWIPELDPMLLLIAGKAYGLADAPLERENLPPDPQLCPDRLRKTLGVTIPTATLLANPVVTLKPLFAKPEETFQFPLLGTGRVSPLSQPDRLVLLKAGKDGADFLLYGSRFRDAKDMNVDPPVQLNIVGYGTAEADAAQNMRSITLSREQLNQYRFLVITRKDEAPEAIAIPPVTPPASGPASAISIVVMKGEDTAEVTGPGLEGLGKVSFKGKEIKFKTSKDGKSVMLLGLRAAGVTAGTSVKFLDFYLRSPVKVDVFSAVIQTAPRP